MNKLFANLNKQNIYSGVSFAWNIVIRLYSNKNPCGYMAYELRMFIEIIEHYKGNASQGMRQKDFLKKHWQTQEMRGKNRFFKFEIKRLWVQRSLKKLQKAIRFFLFWERPYSAGSKHETNIMPPQYIAQRWKIRGKIGEGGYGSVYKATDKQNGDSDAVKIEYLHRGQFSFLGHEYEVYRSIRKLGETSGIPKFYHYGRESGYAALVMQRLGASLYKIRSKRALSQTSILMVAIQALKRIEMLHTAGYVHRDITPSNLLIGYKNPCQIYLIDFGLAKRYKDKDSHEHISFRSDKVLCGTRVFCSSNADFGRELSRRDDLEGLGYCLLYLFHGKLPWTNVGDDGRRGRMKRRSVDELCSRMSYAFKYYFTYVRSLDFSDKPSYSYLTDLFNTALKAEGIQDDRNFDWIAWNSLVQQRVGDQTSIVSWCN